MVGHDMLRFFVVCKTYSIGSRIDSIRQRIIIAYGASPLITYLPARQVTNVYPAEALRFE